MDREKKVLKIKLWRCIALRYIGDGICRKRLTLDETGRWKRCEVCRKNSVNFAEALGLAVDDIWLRISNNPERPRCPAIWVDIDQEIREGMMEEVLKAFPEYIYVLM